MVIFFCLPRDGAAKGKIERFFRCFRDRFLVQHLSFDSLDELNDKTWEWIENAYNSQHHSGIQMAPLDRFNLDRDRLTFLTDDETTDEIFFVEETRKASKTNVFSINSQKGILCLDHSLQLTEGGHIQQLTLNSTATLGLVNVSLELSR